MTRIRGWCPSLYDPMASGDGLLVRVKPPLARLSAEQALVLAEAAGAAGNGRIELTQRANLQVRGLTAARLPGFVAALRGAGLADPDPGVERRRNLIPPPLPSPAAEALCRALEAVLAAAPAALPGKFGLALAEAAEPCPGADIMLRLAAGGVTLRLAGGEAVARCAAAEAPAAVARLIATLLDGPPGRMAQAVREQGAAALFARAGLAAGASPPPEEAPAGPPVGPPVGPSVGALAGGFGLGLPFGVMTVPALRELAALAAAEGDGSLRLTPWRSVLLPGVRRAAVPGLIDDPADPRLALRACPGSEGCASGRAPVRREALALLGLLRAPPPGLLHLSGCAKGCAHPGPAALVLVAEAPGRYALVRHGRAGDAPLAAGLSLAEAAARMEER